MYMILKKLVKWDKPFLGVFLKDWSEGQFENITIFYN